MSAELAGLLFTGVGVLVLIAIALRAEKRAKVSPSWRQVEEDRLTTLEQKLKYLQEEDIRKGQMIAALQTELSAARERIRFLEGQQASKPIIAVIEEQPLMVVIGDDPLLLTDLAALRGARGLEVTTLLPGTYRQLKRVIENNRLQGKPIEYAHFAVHADAEGIQLDRKVTGVELSELLDGVKVAVIMGCVTAEIADWLAVVPSVVAFRIKVPHDEAWKFSFLFWKAIGEGLTPAQAFKRAKERGPTRIGENAELIEM